MESIEVIPGWRRGGVGRGPSHGRDGGPGSGRWAGTGGAGVGRRAARGWQGREFYAMLLHA